MPNPTKNEGEGSRSGARAYDRHAERFRESGAVPEAAEAARAALEADPEAHRAAEEAGKARAREEDPEIRAPGSSGPGSAWERVKAAVRRDWEQTKRDFSGGSAGAALDQGVMDTLRQMTGSQSVPPRGEPAGVSLDIDWGRAEPAVRFGYDAASRHRGDWGPETEAQLANEWRALQPDYQWNAALPHVFIGWRHRRGLIQP